MVTQPGTDDASGACARCGQPLGATEPHQCSAAVDPSPREDAGDDPQALLGQVVDRRYEIEVLLGIGGMGLVYRARHILLDKRVALKVLRRPRDERARRRFLQEARAASRIEHDAVVAVLDFGVLDDGRPYLVMALVAGQTLAEALRAGPLVRERACRIATQVARGLAAVHQHGIVHRDVKPENILLRHSGDRGEQAQLADFGIALVPAAERLTSDGAIIGTAAYMAPEQARGEGCGPESDQFALGCVLFEMLTGRPLRSGSGSGAAPSRATERTTPLPLVRTGSSARLDEIVRRALAEQPSQRFPNMEALAAALEAEQKGGAQAASAGPVRRPGADLRGLAVVAAVASGLSLGLWAVLGALRGLPPPAPSTSAPARVGPSSVPGTGPSAPAAPDPAATPISVASGSQDSLSHRADRTVPHPVSESPRLLPRPVPPVPIVVEFLIEQPPADEVAIECPGSAVQRCRGRCVLSLARSVIERGQGQCTFSAPGFTAFTLSLSSFRTDALSGAHIQRRVSLSPIPIQLDQEL